VETASDFKGYIQRCGIARAEGILLRYLSEAYRSLDRTVPLDKRDERLDDIVHWLGLVVRTVDSSLVDEWSGMGEDSGSGAELAAPGSEDEVVVDRRALTLLVRNALWRRVRLAAEERTDELGELDGEWGWRAARWQGALDAYSAEHEEVLLDADAHSWDYLVIDDVDERGAHLWHVRQTFRDPEGDRDFGIAADVDLDETQELGEVVFRDYRVGFAEDLLDL
jgi:hypothetical protein